MLFVCYNLLNRQTISINNNQKRLATYLLDSSVVTKITAEVAQKKEQ